MTISLFRRLHPAWAAGLMLFATLAHAQHYPVRSITFSVPYRGAAPQEYAALIASESGKWARVVRDAKIKPE